MADGYSLPKIPLNYLNDVGDDYDDDDDGDDDDNDIVSVDSNLATVKKRPLNTSAEKVQENNWFNQLKMNSTIAEAIGANSNLEDEATKYKNYLNTLKKNYLENLSLTSPTNKQAAAAVGNRKVATMSNNSLLLNQQQESKVGAVAAATRRKISFTPDTAAKKKVLKYAAAKENSDEDDDDSLSLRDNIVIPKQQQFNENGHQPLSTTQILSRLVQIREYLKQAYSMLTTLQTSNDISSYTGQLEKLNSLIEHLRDQEKGYMDLLNSIIAYQNATKESLSLTAITESVDSKKTTTVAAAAPPKQSTIQTEESTTQELDMSLRDLLFKIRQPIVKSNTQQQQQQQQQQQILSKLIKQQQQEQAASSAKKQNSVTTESSYNSLVGSLMSDSMHIDNEADGGDDNDENMNELEELKEKERLLKSILARREEIRALEGRRKALEALKKAALASEKEFLEKLDENAASAVAAKSSVKHFDDEDDDDDDDDDEDDDEGVENDEDEEEEEGEKADMEPLFKTFYKYLNTSKKSESKDEENDEYGGDNVKLAEDTFDKESYPIVTEKEHKDKEVLKEKLESLQEKKRLVDNLLQDLNRLKDKANIKTLTVDEAPAPPPPAITYSSIKSELAQNQNELDVIKSSVDVTHNADNTAKKAEKIISLLENQEKLEKLHAMQKRLDQLKHIVGHFNDENSIKKMLTNEDEEEEEEEVDDKSGNMDLVDLSEDEKEIKKKEVLFEKYKDEAKSNISQLSSLLNTSILTTQKQKEASPVISNVEEYEEQKKKLGEAKLKLKQLQDLITTIQNMPLSEEKTQKPVVAVAAASESPIANKFKINDGKRVKEFNTEFFSAEDSSVAVKKLHTNLNRSNISPKVDLPQISVLNDSPVVAKNNLDLTIFSDNGLNTSASGNKLQQERADENSSPSDLLWSQMKQQLGLREKLRGKKKELEDQIKNERYYLYEKMNKSKSCDTIVNEDEDDYDDEEEEEEEEEEDEDDGKVFKAVELDESLVKRSFYKPKSTNIHQQQQENVCSADELILQASKIKDDNTAGGPLNGSVRSNSNLESSLVSSVIYNMNSINDLKKQMEDNNHTFECMLKNQNMLSSLLEKNLNAINNTQQQAPKYQPPSQFYATSPSLSASYYTPAAPTPFMMPHPPPPPPPPPPQPINDSYYQYNNHLQMQQLMLNLNAAYREIGLQRNEINNLNLRMHDIDRHLQSQQSSQNSSFIANLPQQQQQQQQQQRDYESSTYLNNYLTMRKTNIVAHSKSLNSYHDIDNGTTTDDNNLRIEMRNLKKLYNKTKYKNRSASSSSSESSTTESTAHSSVTSQSTYSRPVAATAKKSSSVSGSTLTNAITNVTSVTNVTNLKNAAALSSTTSTSFDELRETIYSEVATLISQNETRPQYLLNLFRELQHLKSKISRDQALKSIFNISSRNDVTVNKRREEEDEDNLDETVIYLKMNQEAKSLFDYSSADSSVAKDSLVDSQVKQLSNKILKMITNDNSQQMLTQDYLANLIERIISLMKQKREYHDYLRLYQNQLISYLKEALQKYENRKLCKSLNRILLDISDLLLNELTFYSIMNNSNSNFHKKFQQQQQKQEEEENGGETAAGEEALATGGVASAIKSSASLSSSLSSSKKKTSNFFTNSSTATLTRTKESIVLNNSSSSENDESNKNKNYEDDEFENDDDDDDDDEEEDNDDAAVAGDDDENDYEITADDVAEENEKNVDEEDSEGDESSSDDDDDADKQVLYNICDGSSIRKQLSGNNHLFYPNSEYEKYQMVDPRNGISSGAGTVQSLATTALNDDYNKYLRSNGYSSNPTTTTNSHFIELAQSELKPYSRIGSDEDENEADDDDEQFSDNLETAVSRQPDIAVVQEPHKSLSHDDEENEAKDVEENDQLTVDDLPEKFNFHPNTTIWKDLRENGMINVEQILLHTVPDDLVELDEVLPPSASSSAHQTPLTTSQHQKQEDSDEAQINDFVLINNAKNLSNSVVGVELNNQKNDESEV